MRRVFVVIGALALVLLVYNRLAFSGLILARGDTFNYFYPYWAVRDTALRAFELPLWSPDLFMGVPLLANPQLGTLYIPNWITALLTPPDAITVNILMHVLWALLGAYLLARRVLKLGRTASFIAGVVFALGGYMSAHVEQINQLQGLAWMPWAFLAFEFAWRRPLVYTAPFAVVIAFQILSGHTQTFFITGTGLVIYTLMSVLTEIRAVSFMAAEDWRITLGARFVRGLAAFFFSALIALVLTVPQLWPTLELTGISNRGGGFNPQQAMAFSWNPALAARGLLPSYDGQIFSEYIVYVGVFALCLALVGAFSREMGGRRVIWVVIALVGLFLALGAFNPVYWSLAGLPGFNLFRVPARWLSLFALAVAMLAGMGAHMLITGKRYPGEFGSLGAIGVIMTVVAALTLFSGAAQAEVDGPATPTLLTLAAWVAVFIFFVNVVLLRSALPSRSIAIVILVFVAAELFFASLVMPFNDVTERAAYYDARFSVQQLKALQPDDGSAPGRVLSISAGLFDVGDKATIDARLAALGVSDRARDYAFTAAKQKELIAPNQALVWGVPSIDGYDGGVLPTSYYTQFTSLMLPPEEPRTLDGRLREILAQEPCRGACLPDQRWLNLTNTQYLITDKVFDVWIDGVAYDTTIPMILGDAMPPELTGLPPFTADSLRILYTGSAPDIAIDGVTVTRGERQRTEGDLRFAEYTLSEPIAPQSISLGTETASTLYALTLVDSRTGDFAQVTLGPWRKVLSSDVKIYENLEVLPRAFVVHDVMQVADTWQGTEDALTMMRNPAFDPARYAVLSAEGEIPAAEALPENRVSNAQIIEYSDTRVALRVNTASAGYLILSDAYYPGWRALVNWQPVTLYRANAMFRAVWVPAGQSDVVFEFQPDGFPLVPIGGMIAWGALIIITVAIVSRRGL